MTSSIKFFFRADATPEIGTGHVMRCLAMANAVRERGYPTCFVSTIQDLVLQSRIENAGHELLLLVDPREDNGWLDDLSQGDTNWLILDGYSFKESDRAEIKSRGFRLLVVDDMNASGFYECDIVLNQNFFGAGLSYSCAEKTQVLLGPDYALLREEFGRVNPRRAINTKSRVLVSLGGADPEGVGLIILDAFKRIEEMHLEILYLLGSSNVHADRIETEVEKVRRVGHEVSVLSFTNDMPAAMAWADIGVIAAGSTSLEVAYMGLPCLVLTLAENQVEVARSMAEAGIGESLGWYEDVSAEKIAARIVALFKEESKRASMTFNGQRLVDGAGARRVVEKMLGH